MDCEIDIGLRDAGDPLVAELVTAYGSELIERAPWIEDRVRAWDVSSEEFLVAVVGHAAVGCIALVPLNSSTVELRRMFVSAGARRSGVARRLLQAAEQRSAALGYARLVLDTMSVLGEAVALYRASGYVEIDSYNGNAVADLWFEKRLPVTDQM